MVETYQDQLAIHVYRKGTDGTWDCQSEGGADAVLDLFGTGERLSIQLPEIHQFAMPLDGADPGQDDEVAEASQPPPGTA